MTLCLWWAHALSAAAESDTIEKRGLMIRHNGELVPARFTESDLNRPGMVCIRFNNYWCIKSVGWNGEVGHDSRGHAKFSDPVYSARAAAKQMKTWWYRDERRSAFEIMSAYAPPDDCVGSIGKPPDCPYGINPTADYATRIADAVGKGPRENLNLFNEDGKMNRSVAISLLQAIARFELTDRYEVTSELIGEGIDRAGL